LGSRDHASRQRQSGEDGTANSNVATVSVSVTPVNDAPTISVVAGNGSPSACLGDTSGYITLKLFDVGSNLSDLKTSAASSSDTRLVPKSNRRLRWQRGDLHSHDLHGPRSHRDLDGDDHGQRGAGEQQRAGYGQGRGNGNDRLGGSGASDVLCGANGNDRLTGGAGPDTFDGGLGTDAANFSSSLAAITASLTDNTATGEGSDTLAGIENLVGSSKNDTLTGSEGDNNINGGGLADSLTGMGGADTLSGAGGPDSINSQDGVNGNDSLDGGAGTDTKTTDTTEKSIVGFP
jgi:Ca2+-binding RTX toxin-like protein